MAQQELPLPHKLTLSEREALTVTGVCEVLRFDDDAVALRTTQGDLWIHGTELRMKNLDPSDGKFVLSGKVTALVYEQPQKRGWLSRLFG